MFVYDRGQISTSSKRNISSPTKVSLDRLRTSSEPGHPNTLKLTPSDQLAVSLLNATGEKYVILLDEFEMVELKQLPRPYTFWKKAAPKVLV